MREFKAATKSAYNPKDTLDFGLDGETLTCRRPTTDQVMMLVASEASEIRSNASRTAAFIDVSLSLFDEDSRRLLSRRLLDPDDAFVFMPSEEDPEAASLIGVIQWLLEEWSNRPTKPFSDSELSSENGGTSSTETVSAEGSASSDVPQLMPAT